MRLDFGTLNVSIGLSATLEDLIKSGFSNDNAALARIEAKQAQMQTQLGAVFQLEQKMADTLDDLVSDVSQEGTVIDSAVALLNGIDARIAAAGTDPVKLAALRASIQGKKGELAAAVQANTPAVTTPPA